MYTQVNRINATNGAYRLIPFCFFIKNQIHFLNLNGKKHKFFRIQKKLPFFLNKHFFIFNPFQGFQFYTKKLNLLGEKSHNCEVLKNSSLKEIFSLFFSPIQYCSFRTQMNNCTKFDPRIVPFLCSYTHHDIFQSKKIYDLRKVACMHSENLKLN